jgi:NitT/TauT family transport system substrate-binding protein
MRMSFQVPVILGTVATKDLARRRSLMPAGKVLRFAQDGRLRRVAVFPVVLAALLSACGSTAPAATTAPAGAPARTTSAPASTTGQAASSTTDQPEISNVTLVSSSVSPPNISNIYYYAARDGKFMEKHGLKLNLQQSGGSPNSLAAIKSGTAQFASINFNTLANAAANGDKLKLVVSGNFAFPGALLATKKITDVKQLATAKVGTTQLGAMDQTVAMGIMKAKSIDTSKIEWVATQNTGFGIQYLTSGRIDAQYMSANDVVQALRNPNVHILVDAKEAQETSPNSGGTVVVTQDFLAKNPKTVQAFVSAVIEGNRYVSQSLDNYKTIGKPIMGDVYSDDDYKVLFDQYAPSFGVNGGLPLKYFNNMMAVWKDAINPEKANNPYFQKPADLMDFRFAGVSLKQLGVQKDASDEPDWLQQ